MENEDLSIFKPLTQSEASITVKNRMIVYPTFIRIIKMKVPFQKLKGGMELRKRHSNATSNTINKEDNVDRSLRRTRKAIKDYVLCNGFDAFASFTFNKEKVDRFNVLAVKNVMSNWIKNEQKRKGRFEYVIVCEFHKKCEECVNNKVKICNHSDRLKAMHFHMLLKGYNGKLVQAIDPKTDKELVGQLTIPSFTSGYTNLKKLDENTNPTLIAYYLQKYITKDMTRIFGKNRYWASSNLKKPIIVDNPEPWYEVCSSDRQYENDFCVIEEYDVGKNPLIDMFWEASK